MTLNIFKNIFKLGKKIINFFFKSKKPKQRKRIIKEQLKPKRTRKQICYNSNYGISIRAITINGNWTFKQMEKAINEFMFSNPPLLKIPFNVEGFEETEISDSEETHLKEGSLYIEFDNRGKESLIKWRD